MLCFFCVECRDKTPKNKRYNAYSVVATNTKCPRVDYAFACQPWAIKGTTPTALLPLTTNDPGLPSLSLVNPGLSNVQRLQRCVVRAFMVTDVFIGILARHLRRYVVSAFIMEDISIEIMVHLGVYLFACCHQLYYEMRVSTPSVLRFLSAICHKCLRYTHAFTEKAQHLRR